jgi:hypothetical protein
MTPEHKFTLLTVIFTGLPTILFTGVVAYWTWRRDQERIIVQKSPLHWKTYDGTEGALDGAGVVVKNLSLYPVRISGLAFVFDKRNFFIFDRDEHKDEWPLEIASHARMVVYANPREWKRLEALGTRDKIMNWKFVAVAVTETGSRFASNRFKVWIARPLWFLRDRLSKKRGYRLIFRRCAHEPRRAIARHPEQ